MRFDALDSTPVLDIKPARGQGFNAYCGTSEVNEEKRTVTHHIEGCSFHNWVGKDQERFFKRFGDQLTLSTPPMPLGGTQSSVHLTGQEQESSLAPAET